MVNELRVGVNLRGTECCYVVAALIWNDSVDALSSRSITVCE